MHTVSCHASFVRLVDDLLAWWLPGLSEAGSNNPAFREMARVVGRQPWSAVTRAQRPPSDSRPRGITWNDVRLSQAPLSHASQSTVPLKVLLSILAGSSRHVACAARSCSAGPEFSPEARTDPARNPRPRPEPAEARRLRSCPDDGSGVETGGSDAASSGAQRLNWQGNYREHSRCATGILEARLISDLRITLVTLLWLSAVMATAGKASTTNKNRWFGRRLQLAGELDSII